MRILLLPADVRPGSVIYRLRGTDSDYDYPLTFDVADEIGKSIIRIENMPCTPTHTYCQANVILAKKLEAGRVYDLILSLKDSSGRETKVDCMIRATRASAHFDDAFPYVPNVIMIPESTPVGTVLDYVLARKNPKSTQHAYLELLGSEKFRIIQNLSTKDITNGSITLTGNLDFEEKNMYMLQIFSLDPYTEPGEDTRNIAGFQLAVIVEDDQDMPPIFHYVPPVTRLHENLTVGDQILQIQAEDGDRGNPRQIRYGFASDNPYASYFNISEKTGEIILSRPLRELMAATKTSQPILLTVMAEEVKTALWEPPAMTSTTEIALIIEKTTPKTPPYFSNNQYVARIPENSPQGTTLVFGDAYVTLIRDTELGQEGVFSLSLENNNGTFEISPTIGKRRTNFAIRVRNNEMLDFEERTYVTFMIVARELTTEGGDSMSLSSTANVTVFIDDQNDNPPVFLQGRYEAVIAENVTAGMMVTQVQATDLDTGSFGKVFYTNILGNPNNSLRIDSNTGVITVATNNHGFDRESAEEYRLTVEARDMEGFGNRADVPLVIKLLDVNDETPQFERQVFEFILQPNLRNFTSRAFVKATDKDAEEPNNIVRYEIMSGNYENKFYLDEVTGELFIRGRLSKPKGRARRQAEFQDDFYNNGVSGDNYDALNSVIVLSVRAYDLGIPHRWQHAHVRIYPPESKARNMSFIVSGSNPDRRQVEDLLKQITGGRVIIHDIRPYTGQEPGTDIAWRQASSEADNVVTATVFYEGNSYVDVNQLERRLTANKTQALVNSSVTEYKQENNLLFWLMMFFLILLLLILLCLILCCIWQGCCVCPCCVIDRKSFRISPAENLKFIAHEKESGYETKGVQAVMYPERREAWSGRDNERLYQTKVTNVREKLVRNANSPQSDVMRAAAAASFRHENDENGGPNVIYTREFINKERHPTMLIEDVETDPYNAHTYVENRRTEVRKEPEERLQVNQENDPDSDSMRRHEMERGSDLGKASKDKSKPSNSKEVDGIEVGPDGITQYRLVLERPKGVGDDLSEDGIIDLDRIDANRDQYYIRDGNAEILRLVTRGNQEDRPNTLVEDNSRTYMKLDKGKEIIMKRFMEDQRNNSDIDEELKSEILRQLQRESRIGPLPTQPKPDEIDLKEYVAQLLYRGRNEQLLLNQNYDMDNRTVAYSFNNQETQSLPGQMEISTQTERDFGTQTDHLSVLRPPRRKVRSDNEISDDDDEEYENDEFFGYEDGKIDIAKAVTALNLGKGWVKRNGKSSRFKKPKRYKIKTPILEEVDSPNDSTIKYDTRPAMFKMPEFGLIVNGSGPGAYTENKSSILRRRKMKERITEEAASVKNGDEPQDHRKREKDGDSSENEYTESQKGRSRRSRRDSMEVKKQAMEKVNAVRKKRAESLNRLYKVVKELQDQEQDTLRVESRQRTASLNRLYSVLNEIQRTDPAFGGMKKTKSLTDLSKDEENGDDLKKTKIVTSTPTESSQEKPLESVETSFEDAENQQEQENPKEGNSKRKHSSNTRRRLVEKIRIRESVSEPPKVAEELHENLNSSASVDQLPKNFKSKRSKYMDWYRELNDKRAKKRQAKKRAKKAEDDLDSGIAMSQKQPGKVIPKKNQQFLEKKSIFTIAYDEVQTKNIRPDTNASQKY
ncbi:UNVERIFIED_CONTAM: hypothetical protein PYX00_001863 [Menopon gallinae]|uniref:Cadherin domain-containing protein n=1 Tax=Menopon gallinae TaxID=328185 RepID=A0AAW2IFX6_9NEOP